MLSILHGEAKQREVVEAIGRATSNKVNYRIVLGSEAGLNPTEHIQGIAECLFA